MELTRAAEILIEEIKRDYQDDIALVVIMGSYIYNETHSTSDLEMRHTKTIANYSMPKPLLMPACARSRSSRP